jgi:hypothetical protein
MQISKLALASLAVAVSVGGIAKAEPIGRWWAGYGQGTFEYGIHNDSADSDTIYIACGEEQTYISFRVGGVEPREGSIVIVTIGPDEFELSVNQWGNFPTGSHVDSENFRALWDAARSGQFMRVRLATGQSTVFTLKGAAKTLPKKACKTDFER